MKEVAMLELKRTDEMKPVVDREDQCGGRHRFFASFRVTGLRRPSTRKIARTSSWIRQKFLDLYDDIAFLVLGIKSLFSIDDFSEAVVERLSSGANVEESDGGDEIGVAHLLFVRVKDTETTEVSLNLLFSSDGFSEGPKRELVEIMTRVSRHPDQYHDVFDPVLISDLRRYGLTPDSFQELVWGCIIAL